MPVRVLQGRRRYLPGATPVSWQGLSAPAADRRYRRPHPPRLVPAEGVETAPRASRDHLQRACARHASRARLLAPRWRRGSANGQGAPWPREHLHDREVPAHAARIRRPGAGCIQQDPQPRAREVGVNARTRRAALYAIGAIAILASANALAHSYAGLYQWAVHHRLGGWQARSWPAEIDVFLAVGELALYVAYLDGWAARQRIWPWTTALTGLGVSIAGNIGPIQPLPGHPVILADRLTAAASPVAAFAGLTVGLLAVKMTRQRRPARPEEPRIVPALVLAPPPDASRPPRSAAGPGPPSPLRRPAP